MGIIKKAMQLELITGCSVHLQVINKEDSSLISYGQISEGITCDGFDQYAKFSRDHYDFFSKIENQIQKYGHLNENDTESMKILYDKIEGLNLIQLFSLASLPKFTEVDKRLAKITDIQKTEENLSSGIFLSSSMEKTSEAREDNQSKSPKQLPSEVAASSKHLSSVSKKDCLM